MAITNFAMTGSWVEVAAVAGTYAIQARGSDVELAVSAAAPAVGIVSLYLAAGRIETFTTSDALWARGAAGTRIRITGDILGAAGAAGGDSTAANQEITNERAGVIFRNNPAAFNVADGTQGPITGNENLIPYYIPYDIATGAAAALNIDVGIKGVTPYVSLDVDETEDEVKAASGRVYFIHAMNLAATKRYLKIYDAPAASVIVGTTVPKLVFPVGTLGDTNGQGFCLSITGGILFTTGICIAATTGFAHADTGAPGGNEVIVNLGYL